MLRPGALQTRWLVPSFATGDGRHSPLPWRPDGKAAEQLRNAANDRGRSSLWFPVSSPPNAIIFGTGLVPLRRMIRTGILLDLTALFVIWAGLLLLTPILPR